MPHGKGLGVHFCVALSHTCATCKGSMPCLGVVPSKSFLTACVLCLLCFAKPKAIGMRCVRSLCIDSGFLVQGWSLPHDVQPGGWCSVCAEV